MSSPTIRLLAFTFVIGGGVFSPAPSFPDDYRFLATFAEETRAVAFSMDTTGTLWMGDSYTVGFDSGKIAASPNGQLLIASSGSAPRLTAFFVDPDSVLLHPKYFDPLDSSIYDPPVVFHTTKPWGFANFYRSYLPFRIDYSNQSLHMETCMLQFANADTQRLAYSPLSDHVYHRRIWPPQGISGLEITATACLTTTTVDLPLGSGQMNRDFAVSPDGRWAVALGLGMPQLSIASIHRDGSLSLHQQFSFTTQRVYNPERVRFTHDGRYLILLTDGPHDLISYRYDSENDLWVEASYADFEGGGFDFSITHDDRFLVWIENYPATLPDGYYYRTLQTIQINDDGSFTRLEGKSLLVRNFLATLEFIPPWRESYPNAPHGVMAH